MASIGSISPQSYALPHSSRRPDGGAAHARTPQETPDAESRTITALQPSDLTPEERAETEVLQRRDQEVRAHEQAHAAAGGPLTGQPKFQFERGPDGRYYAVSGEVKIDTSEVPGNPAATIRKMEAVKRAALAPTQPSARDRQVAAEAERKAQDARLEQREEKAEEAAAGPFANAGPEAPSPARISAEYRRNAQVTGAEGGPPAASVNFVV